MNNKTSNKSRAASISLIAIAAFLIVFVFCGRYFNSFVKHIANFFLGCFGMSFYGIMAAVIVFASFSLAGKKVKLPAKYLVHFVLLFVGVVLLVHTLTTTFIPVDNFGNYVKYVYNYYSAVPTFGGVVFGAICYALQTVISFVGAIIVYVALIAVNVFMIGDFFYCYNTGKLDLTAPSNFSVDEPQQTTGVQTPVSQNVDVVVGGVGGSEVDNSRSARDNAMRILFAPAEQSVNPVQVTPSTTQQFNVADRSVTDGSQDVQSGVSDFDQAMQTLFPKEVINNTKVNGTNNNSSNGYFTPSGLEQTSAVVNSQNVGGDSFFSTSNTTNTNDKPSATVTPWQTEPQQTHNVATWQTPVSTSGTTKSSTEETWRVTRPTQTNTSRTVEQTTPVVSQQTPTQPTVTQTPSTVEVEPIDVINVIADGFDDEPFVATPVAQPTPVQPTATAPVVETPTTDSPFDSDDDVSNETSTDTNVINDTEVDDVVQEAAPIAHVAPAQTTTKPTTTVAKTTDTKADKPVHKFAKYVEPSTELLEPAEPFEDDEADNRQRAADAIVRKLHVFNIDVELVDIIVGPAFSRYMFRVLSEKTRMSEFAKYSEDIKGCLEAADSIRIIAPVQGTNLVGVEVPNRKKYKVALRSIIESDTFKNAKGALCFAVGQEISGKIIWKDLAKMPHLLIAGQTGSGKSVCVNCLIVSMLYKYGPEYVRFLMVDPKLVELSRYNGIPHMLTSETITVVNDALAGMDFLINEMENRYQLFRASGVGEIKEYNKRITSDKQPLPYLVLIVDELADLMSVSKQAFENKLGRLAAKSRAAGIHIVLATQRPDVKVITGTIKNNLTARIALTVPTATDSGTILGCGGAEKLLGRGDMLFSDPSAPELERIQGAYVDNDEIRNVVEFTRDANEGYFDEATAKEIFVTAAQEEEAARQAELDAEAAANKENAVDPFCKRALRFWLERNSGKASIASIQRNLGIGFNRAGRILSQLQKLKYVEELPPSEPSSKPPKVLVTLDQLDELFPDLED